MQILCRIDSMAFPVEKFRQISQFIPKKPNFTKLVAIFGIIIKLAAIDCASLLFGNSSTRNRFSYCIEIKMKLNLFCRNDYSHQVAYKSLLRQQIRNQIFSCKYRMNETRNMGEAPLRKNNGHQIILKPLTQTFGKTQRYHIIPLTSNSTRACICITGPHAWDAFS